jgi:hypothetical protein
VPWNPIGAIVGPLGVISKFDHRRKKGGMFLVLLLVMVTVSTAIIKELIMYFVDILLMGCLLSKHHATARRFSVYFDESF